MKSACCVPCSFIAYQHRSDMIMCDPSRIITPHCVSISIHLLIYSLINKHPVCVSMWLTYDRHQPALHFIVLSKLILKRTLGLHWGKLGGFLKETDDCNESVITQNLIFFNCQGYTPLWVSCVEVCCPSRDI